MSPGISPIDSGRVDNISLVHPRMQSPVSTRNVTRGSLWHNFKIPRRDGYAVR
jgi:hypothetical protein